jgi:hypothetical protein
MPFAPIRALLALAAALMPALAVRAQAQAADEPVVSGANVILGSYYEVNRSGCIALSAPRVSITQPPRLGKLTIVHTKGTVRVFNPRCAMESMTLPVSQMLYQADKPGQDTMAWEVRYQERLGDKKNPRRRIERASARVNVRPRPPAPAQPASAQPASAQPAQAQPAADQPAPAQPAPAQPAAAQPAPVQPAAPDAGALRSNTAAKKPSVP